MTYRGAVMTADERYAEILERKRADLAALGVRLQRESYSTRALDVGLRDERFLEIWALETAIMRCELPTLPSEATG